MDLDFDFDCPECGVKVTATVAQVAQQKTVRCRKGHQVRLIDDKGGAKKAKKATDDLDRAIRNLGKRR